MFEINKIDKKEGSKVLLPEELKKIIEPRKDEGSKAIKTHGEQNFLKQELGAKKNLLEQMRNKGLNTSALERDIDTIERKLGGGHA